MKYLKMIFERFSKLGVVINPSKCEFGKTEVTFWGHHINATDISPSLIKTEAILQFPVPKMFTTIGIVVY